MQNFIQEGEVINVVAPSGGYASGDPVVVGGMVGIAVKDAAEGETVAVNLCGVYEVTKATGAVSQGDRIYYDEAEGEFTTVSAGMVFAGFAWADQSGGDATVLVKLMAGDDAGATLAQAEEVDALAGTLTGTVDGTIADVPAATAAVTDTTAASLTSTNTAITSVNVQLKELQTTTNAILTALKDAGLMASS